MVIHAQRTLFIYDRCALLRTLIYPHLMYLLPLLLPLSLFLPHSVTHSSQFLLSTVRSAQSGMPKNVCSETLAAWWDPWTRQWVCRSGAKGLTLPSQSCGLTPPTSSQRPTTFWSTPAPSSRTITRHSTSLCGLECGASASCTTGVLWLRCASLLPHWPIISTSPYDKVRKIFRGCHEATL